MDSKHPDSALIDRLGGSTALAKRLNFDPKNGPQRVNNWKTRGIPLLLRLQRPDVFKASPRKRKGV